LQGERPANFIVPEEKVELSYRLGRIYDGLGRKEEAMAAYISTIRDGAALKV
jgi:hypothetical protein